MIRFLQLFVFFFTYSIEVVVHAGIIALPNQDEITQEPRKCLMAESVCSLKTNPGRKYETKIGTTSVLMGPDTILIRLNQDSMVLVQGEAWVRAEKSFTVRTEYGEVDLGSEGEVWAIREERRALVRAVRVISQVHARNSDEVIPLNPGFEIALEGVAASGHGRLSLPIVINFRDHLRRWGRLFRGTKKEFALEIQKFDPIVKEAAEKSSEFNVEMAQRYLASEKIVIDKSETKKKAYDEQSAKLRAIFRERAER